MGKTIRVCVGGKVQTLPVDIKVNRDYYLEIDVGTKKKKRWHLLHTTAGLKSLVENRLRDIAFRDSSSFIAKLLPTNDYWVDQIGRGKSDLLAGVIAENYRILADKTEKRMDIRYCLMSEELKRSHPISYDTSDPPHITMSRDRYLDEFYRYPPVVDRKATLWPALVVTGFNGRKLKVTTEYGEHPVELKRLWGGRPILTGTYRFIIFGKEKPDRTLLKRMLTYERISDGDAVFWATMNATKLAFGKARLIDVIGGLSGFELEQVALNRAAAEACLITPEGDLTEVWALTDDY